MGAETKIWPTPSAGRHALRVDDPATLANTPPHIPGSVLRSGGAGAVATENADAPPIRAVLFDVEDVLYDASEWYRWLSQIFARHEPRTLEAEFARRWHGDYLPQVYRGQRDFYTAFAECLGTIGLSAGHIEEIVAAGRAQHRHEVDTRRPLPGVRSTLHRLRDADLALGVLTNLDRSSDALRADLARLRLDSVFDCVLTAFDLQTCLPDEHCFSQALSALSSAPDETIFVGHEASELLGARANGLTAVAFNMRQSVPGVASIERFEELVHFAAPAAQPTA